MEARLAAMEREEGRLQTAACSYRTSDNQSAMAWLMSVLGTCKAYLYCCIMYALRLHVEVQLQEITNVQCGCDSISSVAVVSCALYRYVYNLQAWPWARLGTHISHHTDNKRAA
eukprot:4355297-Prymnesium_polylepis.1